MGRPQHDARRGHRRRAPRASAPRTGTTDRPGAGPGSRIPGGAWDRSLPRERENSRNSRVTRVHTVCRPTSSSEVLQQPSRKKPAFGSSEQDSSGSPNTFVAGSIAISRSLRTIATRSLPNRTPRSAPGTSPQNSPIRGCGRGSVNFAGWLPDAIETPPASSPNDRAEREVARRAGRPRQAPLPSLRSARPAARYMTM